MNFDYFVIPFLIGSLYFFIVIIWKFANIIRSLNTTDKKKLLKGLIGLPLIRSIIEIFSESLLHRKIFKVNIMMGLMHSSLAFGWFLLIAFGTIESKIHSGKPFNMPYDPIFLKYFTHNVNTIPYFGLFSFIMDFLLAVVLSGVLFAFIKRFRSMLFGMRRTTNLNFNDKFALYSLWAIFPLRYLAESFSSALYENGGFLTGTSGMIINNIFDIQTIQMLTNPIWWGYSIALCIFFIAIPYSRYMHIPAELLLIFFRQAGIDMKTKERGKRWLELYSCSRCGICIDNCQLSSSLKINNIQPAYFLTSERRKEENKDATLNCLLCGRCETYCPVGINVNNHRIVSRERYNKRIKNNYEYLENKGNSLEQYDVLYFAGCMTHLTPSIKKAMIKIFNHNKINYRFIDENGSICCGRPLKTNGLTESAKAIREKNTDLINSFNGKILVTSCPICYKEFSEEYRLNIPVLHHTQFIDNLIKNTTILKKGNDKYIYHDPCDLGRGSGVYEQPRNILNNIGQIIKIKNQKEKAFCCGGSLANHILTDNQKVELANQALSEYKKYSPDYLVTSCPLCKKSFSRLNSIETKDIAEIVAENIQN
ncbi:MAG: hypothetical protein A2X12_05940 [Bacteroidetes bacterium GWE2_29_8]|nr:MAG: hypothetical protein A2X12_05940 [Bacteroidetes bacterium GWE2_29_8]